jgi:ABC-type multidrug transport system ATPase subunit
MEALLKVVPALPAETETPRLGFSSISKRWGQKVVLDRIDLELPPGSLTWLAGANGAGKTTLLRIACGLLAPDEGSVAFDSLHPRRDRRAFQRRLGFLSAGDRGIYARLSARDHLSLWARLALLRPESVEGAIQDVVERVGLEELLPVRADRLSMGQRQRLRLAMTFLHSPDLVLLDEPLNSLDQNGATALQRCIDDVRARSGVVLWCSPGADREHADFDRRLWLENGKLVDIG